MSFWKSQVDSNTGRHRKIYIMSCEGMSNYYVVTDFYALPLEEGEFVVQLKLSWL